MDPSFFNTDLAITKAFTIHENIVTKFRMDAFNAFNHINPGNPGGNIESEGDHHWYCASARFAHASLNSLSAFSSKSRRANHT